MSSGILTVGEHDTTPIDMEISKKITEILMKQYPGYMWGVNFNSTTGVGSVKCFNLSGNWGYNFKDSDIHSDPDYRVPVRGAGELLERFRQRRGKAHMDELLEAKSVAGHAIFDYHESKNGKVPAIIKLAYDKLR